MRDFAVQFQTLGLLIFFVPVQPEPFQALKDGLHRRLGIALDVGVVEAENHGSAVMAGIKPVENEGPGAANVEKPGRRRGKTDSEIEMKSVMR